MNRITQTEAKEILTKARDLVLANFTTGTLARDKFNASVLINNPDAVLFCSLGALDRVCPMEKRSLLENCLEKSAQILFDMWVSQVNDELGIKAVEKMYNYAIENVEFSLKQYYSKEN